MANGNVVTLVGNITRDPELRFTNTGQATSTFGLAVNRRWQNRQTQEWEEATSFFDIVCWREMAENAAESLSKGSRVIVTGRLDQRSWETPDGDKRSKVEVVADEIGPSIRWATAQVTKNERRGPGEGGPPGRSAAPAGGGSAGSAGSGGRPGTATARNPSDMARNNDRGGTSRRAPKDAGRRIKKKPCALCKDRVEWVDYKDVGMLRKYMSDRGKIRARRVSGNCTQHQRDVAIAIKTARELVLLPYTQRTTTERPGGRGGRGGRDGYSGSGGRRGRDEERSLSADSVSVASPGNGAGSSRESPEVAVAEEVVEATGAGDGSMTEVVAEEVVVDEGGA